jgi:hypothetical protein
MGDVFAISMIIDLEYLEYIECIPGTMFSVVGIRYLKRGIEISPFFSCTGLNYVPADGEGAEYIRQQPVQRIERVANDFRGLSAAYARFVPKSPGPQYPKTSSSHSSQSGVQRRRLDYPGTTG